MKINLDKILLGKTVTIVGGGPSLIGFDFSKLKGYVIAVNHSAKFCNADMLVAIDSVFHKKERDLLDNFKGLKVTFNDTNRNDFIKAELKPDYDILDLDWHILKANMSGYFALALAVELGAEKINLLGFDGGMDKGKEDVPNFHEFGYKGPGRNFYGLMNKYYDYFKNENIINVGIGSRISAFKKVSIESDFYG